MFEIYPIAIAVILFLLSFFRMLVGKPGSAPHLGLLAFSIGFMYLGIHFAVSSTGGQTLASIYNSTMTVFNVTQGLNQGQIATQVLIEQWVFNVWAMLCVLFMMIGIMDRLHEVK